MAGLDALVIGGQRQRVVVVVGTGGGLASGQIGLAGGFRHPELLEQHHRVGMLEIVARVFLLGLKEDIAVGDLVRPFKAVEVEIVDVFDALDIHGAALQTIGQFAGHGRALEARHLLEIGELADLHAVAPAFPAKTPGAERGAFPVILDKAHVMQRQIDADGGEAVEIELLQVGRARLQDDLKLVIVLEAVGVLAIAAILGAARGLHIGCFPRSRPQSPQRGGGVKRAGTNLHVVGLENDTAALGPELLKCQQKALEGAGGIEGSGSGAVGSCCHRKKRLG